MPDLPFNTHVHSTNAHPTHKSSIVSFTERASTQKPLAWRNSAVKTLHQPGGAQAVKTQRFTYASGLMLSLTAHKYNKSPLNQCNVS